MTGDLKRLLALADAPRRQVALAVMLGALTVSFGVGLMATAGFLISRAAEHPPVLSLTVAIVAVRFLSPWCASTIRFTTASPRPVPVALVVKNG